MVQSVLGRGLNALIPTSKEHSLAEQVVLEIPLSLIKTNLHQPRVVFDKKLLDELANSIEKKGVLQPILIRKIEDPQYSYELIAGERRLRACSQLAWEKIPSIVKDVSSKEACELALIENLQRKDLNWIEKALSYRHCMNLFRMTQEVLANKLGLSRSSVANTLRLLNLPQDIQKKIKEGRISFSQAKTLLSLDSEKEQKECMQFIVKNDLNSFEFSKYVQKKNDLKPSTVKKNTTQLPPKKDEELSLCFDLERVLEKKWDCSVKVFPQKKKSDGKIILQYESLDDLKNLKNKIDLFE